MSLDSKICYSSSTTNHPADYFVDKTQITILEIHNILAIGDYNTVTRWRGRSTVHDFLTWLVFSWSLEISMRYSSVLMIIWWIIWTMDMWPFMTVVETRAVLSTQWWPLRYFACSCSAIFPRSPEQRVDRTRRQSESLTAVCIESYFKVEILMVPGWGDGRQQVDGWYQAGVMEDNR